jgi:hypothetical protein
MATSVQSTNAFVATNLQLEHSRSSNIFSGDNFQRTLQKVKAFAEGVLQGIGIAIVIMSVFFLAGLGFYKGSEKAGEIFTRLASK